MIIYLKLEMHNPLIAAHKANQWELLSRQMNIACFVKKHYVRS